jgi:hypothetical protein
VEKLVRCISLELFPVCRSIIFVNLGVQEKIIVYFFLDRSGLEVNPVAGLEGIRIRLHASQPLPMKLSEESAYLKCNISGGIEL